MGLSINEESNFNASTSNCYCHHYNVSNLKLLLSQLQHLLSQTATVTIITSLTSNCYCHNYNISYLKLLLSSL